jgi:nuclease S1
MRLRHRVGVSTATLLIILQAAPAWAWAPLGHRLAGRLAERHLTPQAKAAVIELLEPGESIADASTWADEHRRDVKGSGPWHYVDVPLDQDRYDDRFAGDVPEKGNIVPKIREFRAVLKDRRRPVAERRFALRFLIHLVEDLHMPLHVGDNHDRGGNDTQVQFFDQGTNMHRLWDGDMLARVDTDEDRWLASMVATDTPEARKQAMAGTVEEWATESLLAAREAYKDPVTGRKIRRGTKLDEAYQAANVPVARRRVYQAGVRLAMVLNEIFADDAGQPKGGVNP